MDEKKNLREFSFRHGFVPDEVKTSLGVTVFRTSDGKVYHRDKNGSIRRGVPKAKEKPNANS